MISKNYLLLLICISFAINSNGQDSRLKLKEYVNREIYIPTSFAGQSITLIKEAKDYYILRKVFGSGVAVLETIKYKVNFDSKYQIKYSEPVAPRLTKSVESNKEDFQLSVEESGLCLYLNGLKLVIDENYLSSKTN